jgi:hypothetical protein
MLEINSRVMEDILKGKAYPEKKPFDEDRLSVKSGSSIGSFHLPSRKGSKSSLVNIINLLYHFDVCYP